MGRYSIHETFTAAPVTPKERWRSIFAGERPDRIPTDYWATDEVTARLCRDLGCRNTEELYTRLRIDGLVTIDPPRRDTHNPGDPAADLWGLRRRLIDYGGGAYDEFDNHPLAHMGSIGELDAYPWPSADDHDFDAFRNMLAHAPEHRMIRSGNFEPFLLYCALRGLEQAMMDLVAEPEFVTAALGHMFRYYFDLAERTFEAGKGRIGVTYIAEDLGGQTALLMSLGQIRKFFLPNQKKMADLARSHGIHIFYHTDGAVRTVIPDLLDVTGIELLNPIQWRCPGMDREGLVRDFGDRLIFHGAMDNQHTLPFGSPGDVKKEVLENIEIFRHARWVCAPCHNLQPVTPTENIVAMYETIHAYGALYH
jgi:uroporphyrinogen decarboxylase